MTMILSRGSLQVGLKRRHLISLFCWRPVINIINYYKMRCFIFLPCNFGKPSCQKNLDLLQWVYDILGGTTCDSLNIPTADYALQRPFH
jgi:hypothetical protein